MKKLLGSMVAAAAVLAALIPAAHAATSATNFTMTMNVTAACTVSQTTAASIAYTDGAAPVVTPTVGVVNVKCTTGFPYTLAFTNAGTNTGTLAGLNYSLTLASLGGNGTGFAAGTNVNVTPGITGGTVDCTAAVAGGINGARVQNATGCTQTATHVLTVTY